MILESTKQMFTGILKHFDENKNYGFILRDVDLIEIFFTWRMLLNQNQSIKTFRYGNIIKVSFECVKYIGKYNFRRKALEVTILEESQKFWEIIEKWIFLIIYFNFFKLTLM